MNKITVMWERYKAWRRGERMLAGVTKGRCFVKKDNTSISKPGSPSVDITVEPTLELVGIRVTRADGTVEEIQ